MASKLGYTFYPKDWQTNDKVFELSLEQRAVFRELIDLAMINDNKIHFKYSTWSRKLGVEPDKLESIINSLIEFGLVDETETETLFVPSCEKRLNLKRGGAKGGKKSSKNKPNNKPIVKPNNKPTPKQIKEKEKENRKEIEVEVEIDQIDFDDYDNNTFKDIENHKAYYLKNLRLRNAFCDSNKIRNEDLPKRLNEFHKSLESKGRFKETFNEYANYFLNWHKKTPMAKTNSEGRIVANFSNPVI